LAHSTRIMPLLTNLQDRLSLETMLLALQHIMEDLINHTGFDVVFWFDINRLLTAYYDYKKKLNIYVGIPV
jgi:hypothetical protein